MNFQLQKISETLLPASDYVYQGDHRFFSDYASKLSLVLSETDWSSVVNLAKILLEAKRTGARVFLCGNGGSAANATHIANDLVYAVTEKTGQGIDAISLSANPAILTCLANDLHYDHIYSEQLAVSGRAGDLLIALSGSGNSTNIINALKTANKLEMNTTAILGFDGGVAKALAKNPIHFEVHDMQLAEDLQQIVGHMVMRWLKAEINV